MNETSRVKVNKTLMKKLLFTKNLLSILEITVNSKKWLRCGFGFMAGFLVEIGSIRVNSTDPYHVNSLRFERLNPVIVVFSFSGSCLSMLAVGLFTICSVLHRVCANVESFSKFRRFPSNTQLIWFHIEDLHTLRFWRFGWKWKMERKPL